MICISAPAQSGFVCSAKGDIKLFIPYDESDNFVAFSPSDANLLLNYCFKKKK